MCMDVLCTTHCFVRGWADARTLLRRAQLMPAWCASMPSMPSMPQCLETTDQRKPWASSKQAGGVPAPEILGANGELYTTLSSRVVGVAKSRALSGCLSHGALQHLHLSGSPVHCPRTVPLLPSDLGMPLDRGTTGATCQPCPAAEQSVQC
jgi:hypothetical protein